MGESTVGVISARFKRENCKCTKHDSAYSQWKVLIGPSDWEDHTLGKGGAERYRVHNLPNCSSCPGLYELGIAVSRSCSGRETSKLDPDRIIPVYLGQADNVRTRLQHYGREGAHLKNVKSVVELNENGQQGPGLFPEVFSRGDSIVYRWVPMKSKKDAEKTEAELLDRYDYAWNKGSNGVRRPCDILQKNHKIASHETLFPSIARKLQNFPSKKMGIKIEACEPIVSEGDSGTYANQENKDLLPGIFKIGRSQPRQVPQGNGFNDDHFKICGVALGRGSVCRRPPVEGRKRRAEHKGMKINGFTSKLVAEGKSITDYKNVESSTICKSECKGYQASNFSYENVKPQLVANGPFPICGVIMSNGSPCRRQPIKGRKRCEQHKGRRVT